MMTRNEVFGDYDVDKLGIIRSPGKFEGEMVYVPALYDALLDGCSEASCCGCEDLCDCGTVEIVEIDDAFAAEFPEVGTVRRFLLCEDAYGFIYCEACDAE